MYPFTERCSYLREEAVNKQNNLKYHYAHRQVYFTLGCNEAETAGLTYAETVASGMARIINSARPFIGAREILVGTNYGEAPFDAIPAEKGERIASLRENGVSESDIERFLEIADKCYDCWWYVPHDQFTQEETWSEKERASTSNCQDSNHSVLNYEKVVKLGYEGILKEVEAYEAKNGTNPTYRSMKIICKAACNIGERFAKQAEEMLGCGGEYSDEDLKRIIDVCSRVPRHPAGSFHEAVQAILFAHYINTWEDAINANSLGRLDQILYPYYKADVENGVITKEEAHEIICCLWIKLYRVYDVQQSCVGGTSVDGKSQVNELSYMMLDAMEQLNYIRCVSVRFSEKTEKEFLKRALEVVGHLQNGVPFFFNDDVMIPALVGAGIAPEDAHDYTQIGCVETVIPGKSNPHAITGRTNLLKALEYVLGNGHSLMYPEMKPGVETGELDAFDTFEAFYDALLVQINKMLDLCCSKISKARVTSALKAPRPFKSLLTEGCIESGRDFNNAGALYDFFQIGLMGVPNLTDSLMVIKKFVYDDKKYTLAELKDILVNDFPDESVRREFMNKAPKFGNDIDEVDRIAVDIVNKCCDMLKEIGDKYNMSCHAQPFTYIWMIDHGETSIASPDGRRAGDVLAYSVSPMQGRDNQGLTAVFNSVSKLPTKRTPGTCSAIIEADPKLFNDDNIDTLTDILIASGKKGLSNVQFNIANADTLIEAKKYPEKYNNLAVRVSGFSQRFIWLGEKMQDHIIARTKHTAI